MVMVFRDTYPIECPQCDGAGLSTQRVMGIVRHRCANCKGVWFDRDDLVAVGDQLDVALDEPLGALVDAVGPRGCPRCARAMLVELVDARIRIDICHDHGVWLDQGQIEDALSSLMSEQDRRRPTWRDDHPWWRDAIRAVLSVLD
jgi:Zn-finger nucleic acid-binding protein